MHSHTRPLQSAYLSARSATAVSLVSTWHKLSPFVKRGMRSIPTPVQIVNASRARLSNTWIWPRFCPQGWLHCGALAASVDSSIRQQRGRCSLNILHTLEHALVHNALGARLIARSLTCMLSSAVAYTRVRSASQQATISLFVSDKWEGSYTVASVSRLRHMCIVIEVFRGTVSCAICRDSIFHSQSHGIERAAHTHEARGAQCETTER